MRDFLYERLNAADFHTAYRADDLSWSPAQHRLLGFCERAYFIRYFVARGGWDTAAHPIVRTAYLEKWFHPLSTWLGMTLERALVEAVPQSLAPLHSPKLRRLTLIQNLYDNLNRAEAEFQRSVRNRLYLQDYKEPCISEIYHGSWTENDLADFLSDIRKTLRTGCNSLIFSRTFDELANFSFLEFRLKDKLLSVPWNGYNLWLQPGLHFIDRDTALRLRCHYGHGPDEGSSLTSRLDCALFAEYCTNACIPRDVCNIDFNFDENSYGIQYSPPDTNLYATVKADVNYVMAKLDANCEANLNDFPKSAVTDKCTNCRFRSSCNMIDSYVAEGN